MPGRHQHAFTNHLPFEQELRPYCYSYNDSFCKGSTILYLRKISDPSYVNMAIADECFLLSNLIPGFNYVLSYKIAYANSRKNGLNWICVSRMQL